MSIQKYVCLLKYDLCGRFVGKIAAFTLAHPESLPTDRGAGAGKMYAPAHRPGDSATKHSNNALNTSNIRSPNAKGASRGASTPQSQQQQQHETGGGGFRDPTFSELMRRLKKLTYLKVVSITLYNFV